MKNLFMKLNLVMLVLVGTSSFAFGAMDVTPLGVNAWPNDHDKIVAIAANPTLSVSLNEIDVDDDNFAVMQVSLAYIGKDVSSQMREILARYPGYNSQLVILEKKGVYHYAIPALGISNDVDPKPGVDGPYVEDTLYLTKAQTKLVRAEMAKRNPVVQITGSVIGTIPLMKVLEHKELDGSICSKLLGDDTTIGSLIMRVAGLQALARMDIRYDETRNSLVKDIQTNCFDVTKPSQVSSFGDLLTLPVSAKYPTRPLIGEALQKTLVHTEIPLQYASVQTDGQHAASGVR